MSYTKVYLPGHKHPEQKIEHKECCGCCCCACCDCDMMVDWEEEDEDLKIIRERQARYSYC